MRPRPKDWAALAKLPDWSGVWNPNITLDTGNNTTGKSFESNIRAQEKPGLE